MAHPDSETFVITTTDETTEEEWANINAFLAQVQDEQISYDESVAKKFGISVQDAMLITYLRNRSRWTQEKEDYLISLAQQGLPLPNVLGGEF